MDFARFSTSAVPSGNRLHGVLENQLVYRWFSIETSIVDFPVAACLITEGYRYLLHTHLFVFLFPPDFLENACSILCKPTLAWNHGLSWACHRFFHSQTCRFFWNRKPQSAYMIFVYSFVLMVPYGSKSHHSFQCYPLVNVYSSRHRKWPSRNSWFTHDLPSRIAWWF